MARMRLIDYLFKRIKEHDVDTTFGIPGDFVLPIYAAQERAGLRTIVMTHEPSVGFAADAYARLRGLGIALVTYGAGGLNMVNSVGLAYAEESPLLVISGAPETRYLKQKPHLHHCVKTFDTQLRVFKEVTESQTFLDCPKIAQAEIDRVISTTIKLSRPGYIEIPRDMVNTEIEIEDETRFSTNDNLSNNSENPALEEALGEIASRLSAARHPVVLAGVEVRRFGLKDKLIELVEALNLPVVTSILGKASFPESHPNFIGNYFGQFGNPAVKDYVENADCILSLGAVLTEMETAGYTARLPQTSLIQATAHEIAIGYHNYEGPGITLARLIEGLLSIERNTTKISPPNKFEIPNIDPEDLGASKACGTDRLSVASIIDSLNSTLSESYSVVSDVGDCLYAGLSLRTDIFIAPGYYSSMGFGVPAGIGAQIADPSRRPIILVGDGGFQMTGMEISTAVKSGINPIVIVFNNASYAMLKFIDQDRHYYDLAQWDYAALARAVGAEGEKAETVEDFQKALTRAKNCQGLFIIDAVIASDDISPTLRRLTDHFGAKVKAAIG